MIIKKIYYGRREISSIILNGKTVWTGRKILDFPYDIYLTVNVEEEANLSEYIIKEILSGDIRWIPIENTEHNGTLIRLSTGSYIIDLMTIGINNDHVTIIPVVSLTTDKILNHKSSSYYSHLTIAPIILGFDDFNHFTKLTGVNRSAAYPIVIFHATDDQKALIYSRLAAFSADALVPYHKLDQKVSVATNETGISADAVVSIHKLDCKVSITHTESGISADARSGGHTSKHNLHITHTENGIDAHASSGDHRSYHNLFISHLDTGVVADARVGVSTSGHVVNARYLNDGVSSNVVNCNRSLRLSTLTVQKLEGVPAIIPNSIADITMNISETDTLNNVEVTGGTAVYDKLVEPGSIDDCDVTISDVIVFYKNTDVSLDDIIEDYVYALDAIPMFKFITLTPVDTVDGKNTSLDSVCLCKNDILNACPINKGGISTCGNISLQHYHSNAGCTSIEGEVECATNVLGNISRTDNLGITDADSVNVVVTNQHTEHDVVVGEDCVLNVEFASSVDGKFEGNDSVSVDALTGIHVGRIVSCYADLYSNSDDWLDTPQPEYIYPVQTDNNLYIQQIYTAIPAGTNLSFTN